MQHFPHEIFDSKVGRTVIIKSFSCKDGMRMEGTPSALLRFSIVTLLTYEEVDRGVLPAAAGASRDHVIESMSNDTPAQSAVVVGGQFPTLKYRFDHPEEDLSAQMVADIVSDVKVATDREGQSSMTWTIEGWMACKYVGKLGFMTGKNNAALLRIKP
jgi:hypothetical protein